MKRLVLPLACAGMLASLPLGAQGLDPEEAMRDVVFTVEQRLQQRGYAVSPDGRFDADLRNSVLLFQSDSGLRPTGTIDLSTLAALGIDVAPTGAAMAMAPQPRAQAGDQLAMAPQTPAPALQQPVMGIMPVQVILTQWDYPLLRDEHMSAPQTAQDFPFHFENVAGIPQSPRTMVDEIAGIPPAYAEHDIDFY